MPVTCVARAFYAEFDDVKGPVVLYEEPPGCLTRDEEGRRIWECFGDYVITGREPLDGVAVRARAGRDAVLCVPQICGARRATAERVALRAGRGGPGADLPAATGACLPALQRLSRSLRAPEAEARPPWAARKERLEAALPAVLEALERAAAQACRRHVPPAPPTPGPRRATRTSWPSRALAQPQKRRGLGRARRPGRAAAAAGRRPYEVPILLARPRDLLRLSSHRYGDDAWDLAVQQVIPHVDGVRSAKQLARAARVDLDVVRRCAALRHSLPRRRRHVPVPERLPRHGPALAAGGARRALRPRGPASAEARKSLQGLDALRLYCAFQDARSVKDVLLEAAWAAPTGRRGARRRACRFARSRAHGSRRARLHRLPGALRAAQPSRARRRRRPSSTMRLCSLQAAAQGAS